MKKLSKSISSLDVTDLFDQSEWDNGGGPLSDESLQSLGLEDITGSHIALSEYCGLGDVGGFYRATDGSYWRADFFPGDEVILNQISAEEIEKIKEDYEEQ